MHLRDTMLQCTSLDVSGGLMDVHVVLSRVDSGLVTLSTLRSVSSPVLRIAISETADFTLQSTQPSSESAPALTRKIWLGYAWPSFSGTLRMANLAPDSQNPPRRSAMNGRNKR